MVESRTKFENYLDQLAKYSKDLPSKRGRKLLKILIIFRVINIFQIDRNFAFFVIYSYKINILPSTWDY